MNKKLIFIIGFLCSITILFFAINSYMIFFRIQSQQEYLKQLQLRIVDVESQVSGLGQFLTDINRTALTNMTELKTLIDSLTSNITKTQNSLDILLDQTPANIYERAYKSVVVVTTPTKQGSGFLYGSNSVVLTNWHVVEGETQIFVRFYDGSHTTASIVGVDAYSDVAILRLSESNMDNQPLILGDSSRLYVGQHIVAIGNPLGLTGSLSSGYIGQINKLIDLDPIIVPVLQLDMSIAPGSSGGPLLNLEGHVVGITNAGTNYGINFAIPSNIVERVVISLIEDGNYQHPLVGFWLIELSPETIQNYNILNVEPYQTGLLVLSVMDGYPAAEAGIQGAIETNEPDGTSSYIAVDIILTIDDHPVHTIAEWTVYIEENISPGQTIALNLWRSGFTESVNVTVTNRPAYEE